MPGAFAPSGMESDAMELILNRFGYFFSVEGRRGGLFSTDWHFLPAPDADRDEARAGMEAAVGVHADALDRLFASVLSGKRQESLSDGPSHRAVGYRYRGSLTPWGALIARRRLRTLFGPKAAGTDPQPVGIGFVEASVEWQRVQQPGRGGAIELQVKHQLGHAVNVCLFRHLRAGDRFQVSAGAEVQARALEELLGELERGKVPTDPRSLSGP